MKKSKILSLIMVMFMVCTLFISTQKNVQAADVLIIGGTSLSVYPAASLVNYYMGSKLVLINKTPTPMDKEADLLITEPIGKVFSELDL